MGNGVNARTKNKQAVEWHKHNHLAWKSGGPGTAREPSCLHGIGHDRSKGRGRLLFLSLPHQGSTKIINSVAPTGLSQDQKVEDADAAYNSTGPKGHIHTQTDGTKKTTHPPLSLSPTTNCVVCKTETAIRGQGRAAIMGLSARRLTFATFNPECRCVCSACHLHPNQHNGWKPHPSEANHWCGFGCAPHEMESQQQYRSRCSCRSTTVP